MSNGRVNVNALRTLKETPGVERMDFIASVASIDPPCPILGLPFAQQDGLLVARQLQLRNALDLRSPVLLRLVDPVERGPFRAVVLEGVDMGVKGGHGLQLYFPFGNSPLRSSSCT